VPFISSEKRATPIQHHWQHANQKNLGEVSVDIDYYMNLYFFGIQKEKREGYDTRPVYNDQQEEEKNIVKAARE
jgi:hypothetical protein